MKVYILSGGWDYQGLDEPFGAFSSLEKAEAGKAAHLASEKETWICRYDYFEITELDLDE